MKWRNQLLALFCLALFAIFGVFYFQHWVVQKPFGIILFIGEGLTPSRMAATRVFAAGANGALALDAMPHLALLRNFSNDFAAPDTAAAVAAIATGTKVNNRSLATVSGTVALPSLMELARRTGRATGLATDGKLTGLVPAAFYSGSEATSDAALAHLLIQSPNLDVALGGGADQFFPGAGREAHVLLPEIRGRGFDVARSKAELEAIPGWRRPKVLGVFAKSELAYADQMELRMEQPGLPDMVRRGIELLQYNRAGYLLVVDARLMRKAAEENDAEHTLAETLELDRAVSMARRYAGAKSSIFVVGDVGVGGLHLNGAPFRSDRGIAILGLNSSGDPWLSWASGPHGPKLYGAAKLAAQSSAGPPGATPSEPPQEPAAFYAPLALETVEDTIAFGVGQGSERLRGSLDNTAVFQLIRDLL